MRINFKNTFEWWWILASRTDNRLKVMMKEQATGRDFIQTSANAASGTFNGINIDLWAGTAQGGGAWPLAVPYIMPATRVYQFLFTDSSGANNTVQLVLSGSAKHLRSLPAVMRDRKFSLIDLDAEMQTGRKATSHRERLSERTPHVGDATVWSHGNRNHERSAEMTLPLAA